MRFHSQYTGPGLLVESRPRQSSEDLDIIKLSGMSLTLRLFLKYREVEIRRKVGNGVDGKKETSKAVDCYDSDS